MKYSEQNKPLVCMMTNSTCYKGTSRFTPKGVLWHSTGANNPWIRRYVQPSENDPNYTKLMNVLGDNQYNNDWNHIYREAGLNCWIGKLADGTVSTVQTMPWNFKPWGCGAGSKGSCNNTHIQFEICEDGLNDKSYFEKVYKEACELTAYLCKMYNINPKGTFVYNGVTVPTILCHKDSANLGLGGNHGDIYHWFPKFGKSMDDVRNDVAALMGTSVNTKPTPTPTPEQKPSTTTLSIGDEVRLVSGAKYASGASIPNWVINSILYVREIRNNGDVVISTLKSGAVTGVVNPKYLTKNGQTVTGNTTSSVDTPSTNDLSVGDTIKLVSGAKYVSGPSVPNWVINSTLYVRELRSNGDVVFSTLKAGAITGTVARKYILKNGQQVSSSTPATTNKDFAIGDTVKLTAGAKYASGQSIPNWVLNSTLYVRELNGDRVVISVLKTGAITGTVYKKDLTRI